jgi:LCP family protein required for cell wall assembly
MSVPLWGVAGKAGYVLCCIASAIVLMTSGFSYFVVKDVSEIGGSHAIVSGPSIGAQNILLMGLESRTDWDGNILPTDILNALHAGSKTGVENGVGGNATNTLILLHIPAGGGKVIGYSIPRDDWVTFADTLGSQQQGKIDQAYGVSMAAKENQLRSGGAGLGQNQIAFQGNEAGRAAAIATVSQLTGVHIDHFAEVNLDGFYELAKVFGGVEVCLNHNVPLDANSGFEGHKGYQHLSAKMALAFVRQRDGLTNGDLDRTHRQQAFIDSVLQQMRTEGVLSDLTKIQALLSVAKQYVITDQGWNLLDFATQMRNITAGDITFRTLPIQSFATYDVGGTPEDVNVVDPSQIQQIVHNAFYPAPVTQPSPTAKAPVANPATNTVDVYNGGSTQGLAGLDSAALVHAGYKAGSVGNTATRTSTAVLYGAGTEGSADAIASDFGVTAQSSASVAAGHVEILLGADATAVPTIGSPGASSGSASPASSSSSTPSDSGNGANGGAVNALNGIPCVD